MTHKQLPVFLLLLLLSSFQFLQSQTGVSIISLTTFEKAISDKNVQLIDVRTSREYKQGFIAHAQNIPIAKRRKFKKRAASLDKEQAVYIYCHSGVRSSRASRILGRLGFQEIYDFKGGWKAWIAQ